MLSVCADRSRHVELDIWRKVFGPSVNVAAEPGLIAAAGHLYVLLRHRPRSISPWPAGRQSHGFHAFTEDAQVLPAMLVVGISGP